jgi:hypothetical protein
MQTNPGSAKSGRWSRNGTLLADLTHIAANAKTIMEKQLKQEAG